MYLYVLPNLKIFWFYLISEVDGHKGVYKDCNPLHMDEQCVKETLPEFGVESEVCFCNTDLCNSSTSIVGNYAIFGTMMIFFFL